MFWQIMIQRTEMCTKILAMSWLSDVFSLFIIISANRLQLLLFLPIMLLYSKTFSCRVNLFEIHFRNVFFSAWRRREVSLFLCALYFMIFWSDGQFLLSWKSLSLVAIDFFSSEDIQSCRFFIIYSTYCSFGKCKLYWFKNKLKNNSKLVLTQSIFSTYFWYTFLKFWNIYFKMILRINFTLFSCAFTFFMIVKTG